MTKYKYGTSGADTIFSDSQYYDLESTRVYGGAGNDSIFGGTGTDYLYGEDGNDYLDDHSGTGALFGGNGNDTLVAGIGHTTLNGGNGNDLFVFTNGSTGYFHVQDGDAVDIDRIVALTSDTKIGLKSIVGIDSIQGGGYSNVTIETYSDGGVFDFSNTVLTGIAAINGGSGSDTIIGSAGDDLIFGGWVGDDVLQGGAGNDTLKGDGGTILTGGSGADLFVCSASGLTVTDFNAAEGDRIGLPAGAAWTATDVAGGTRLVATFGTSSMRFMTLNGVTADQVDASWFVTAT